MKSDIKTLDTLSDIQIDCQEIQPSDIFDFTQSIESFVMAMNFYNSTNNQNDVVEALCRIEKMYSITDSSIVKKYILKICTDSNLPFDTRIGLACNLCQITASEETYNILSELCATLMTESTLPILLKINILIILFRSDNFSYIAINELEKILQDQKYEAKFRYGIITSLSIKLNEWKASLILDEIAFDNVEIKTKFSSLQLKFFEIFLKDEQNIPSFRILAGQQCCIAQPTPEIQDQLLSIACDLTIAYNARADASDVLLRYGTDDYKKKAKDIISILGGSDNVYENAQNAHNDFIESSALELLKKITVFPIIDTLDFSLAKECILSNTINPDKLTKVFERIEFDRAMYSSMNLSQILVSVVSYMLQFEHRLTRLVSELEDCDEICSTGIMERILNSLSGCDELLIKISYEDQIKNNFIGRLNAKIKLLDNDTCMHHEFCNYIHKVCNHTCGDACNWNDDFKTSILWELTIPDITKRQNLLVFYRKHQSVVITELKEEFAPFVDDHTFDLYIRKAMIAYD